MNPYSTLTTPPPHICTSTSGGTYNTWTVSMGTSTVLGTAAYPYATSSYLPSKPTPYWQKHKREPKWHLYANGGALCEGFQEQLKWQQQYPYTSEYLTSSDDPPSHDKCEDCLAEYAALKLQDKVE